MNKKTTIIIAFLFAAIGIILTGLFGEAASSSDYRMATYCEFNVETEEVKIREDGKKYMDMPQLVVGDSYSIYLNEYISYDEEATLDISEIDVKLATNHPEAVTLRNVFILTFDATSKALPADLSVKITISTNDGSNLSDKLYIVNNPSDIPIAIDPDF